MKNKAAVVAKHFILLPAAVVFAFPFVWMVMGAFKTNNEIWQTPYKLLPAQFDIGAVLKTASEIHFGRYVFNSFFVGVVGTLAMLAVTTLFAYAVVFMPTRWTRGLFAVIMGLYMLPGAVTYVPSYVILSRIGLIDTLTGLMFSYLANIFALFYLRQSFMKTSRSYVEAARIDGAGHLKTLWHVIFPMNRSAFFTVFVLTFIQQYNNYMWPSIMLNDPEKYLVSQGLRQFFIQEGAYGMNWSEVMLASTLAILPVVVLFIIAQKWFLTGIAQDSGLK